MTGCALCIILPMEVWAPGVDNLVIYRHLTLCANYLKQSIIGILTVSCQEDCDRFFPAGTSSRLSHPHGKDE